MGHRPRPMVMGIDAEAARVSVAVFAAALALDLLTKLWAVASADMLTFNGRSVDLAHRALMSLVAVAAAVVLAKLAAARGLGRQWGVWVGTGLLVAGIAGNGLSGILWPGVPDFIDLGQWLWNVADFEIAVGLVGGIASIGASAVAVYLGERRRP